MVGVKLHRFLFYLIAPDSISLHTTHYNDEDKVMDPGVDVDVDDDLIHHHQL